MQSSLSLRQWVQRIFRIRDHPTLRVYAGSVQPTGIGVRLRPNQFRPWPVGLPANRLSHRIQSHGTGRNLAANSAPPFAGIVADRFDRRLVMAAADAGAGLSTLVVALLMATGRLEIWHLYVATLWSAAFSSFQWPAYSAATVQLVPKAAAWPGERPGEHRPRRQ